MSLNYRTGQIVAKKRATQCGVASSLVKSPTINECYTDHSNGVEALQDTAS